jgi:hypothetical protein
MLQPDAKVAAIDQVVTSMYIFDTTKVSTEVHYDE